MALSIVQLYELNKIFSQGAESTLKEIVNSSLLEVQYHSFVPSS